MKSIESRVADTVLQKEKDVILGGRHYTVAPPTIGTLILVSEAISRLPHFVAKEISDEEATQSILAVAKDCGVLAEITAILILGAQVIRNGEKVDSGANERGLWRRLRSRVRLKDGRRLKDELVQEILMNASPSQLCSAVMSILDDMELADFFGVTTFLSEVNLLRPTKVVSRTQKETTASGL